MENAMKQLSRVEDFVKNPTFSIKDKVMRFKQTDQIFSRAVRGEVDVDTKGIGVTSPPPHPLDRTVFSPFMIRAQLWGICEPQPLKWQVSIRDKQKMSSHIKETAQYFGADLVGITPLYKEFIFEDDRNGKPIDLSRYRYAIVIAKAMDYERIRTGPSWMDHADEGMRYQQLSVISTHLALYIAQLGYRARASCAGNDVVLHIPLAVCAGLGELSRIGIIITKKYGPRVRLATVVTDLPLEVNHPVDLNVGHYCELCKKCVTNCPSGAIAKQKTEIRGVVKWKVDDVKCYRYWRKNPMNWQACIRCVAVCPWNKPNTPFHRVVAGMVSKYPTSHRLVNLLDDFVYGRNPKQKAMPNTFNDFRMAEEDYWEMVKDTNINIKMLTPEKKRDIGCLQDT
jgi:reductive dehalogenase